MRSVQYFWQYDPHCSPTHRSLKPWHQQRKLHHSLCDMCYLQTHLTNEKKDLPPHHYIHISFNAFHLLWDNAKPQRYKNEQHILPLTVWLSRHLLRAYQHINISTTAKEQHIHMYLDFRESFLKIPKLNFKELAGVSLMKWRKGKDISRHISRVCGGGRS